METVIRVTIVYFLLMFAFRVVGKRQLSKMAPFELVTLILIPEIFAQGMIKEDFSLTNAIIAGNTIFLLIFLTSAARHKWKKVRDAVDGQPTVLVSDGQFVDKNLDFERVQPEEVYSEMHKVGLSELDQVRWAILETDGKISIISAEGEDRYSIASEDGPM
jgi:uncharacterized membrane protein YcaP (DUF421 family)